jgi:hypothetical protein
MATLPDNSSSIGELLRQLVEDVGHLFRTELRLAQAEVRSNVAGLKGGIVAIAAGGVFLLVSLFTLVGAFVGWLTPYVGAGWAAFIVAVVLAVAGLIAISVGSNKLKVTNLAPQRTVASIKQDAETLKGNI